jgi:HAD superfamily hydrolase (TIGR01549 family)
LIKKNDEETNNLDYYLKIMAEKSGKNEKYWYDLFINFYENEFPKLNRIIKPNDELLEFIKKSKHQLIFASNPVFPKIAVEKRLNFIDMTFNDFEYVSYMENSHYCKPNPKFFIEIINKLKIDPKECIMIGDTAFDEASEKAGIKFIHVDEKDKWKDVL